MYINSIHDFRECQAFFTIFVNNIIEEKSYMKIFGERLKEIRTEKHLKQSDIASLLNVSGNTVHAWETDKQEPSMSTLLKLSEILEVSVDYLLGKTNY